MNKLQTKKISASREKEADVNTDRAQGQNNSTPRPWHIKERISHGGTRFLRIGAKVTGRRGIQMDWPVAAVYREDQGNAELIVKAVNAFEDMKEALETIAENPEPYPYDSASGLAMKALAVLARVGLQQQDLKRSDLGK